MAKSKGIDNSKIEEIATNAVRMRFAQCPLVKAVITTEDKVPLNDGYLELYDSNQFNVQTISSRVPVQVKGTCKKVKESRLGREVKFPLKDKVVLEKYGQVLDGILFFYVCIDARTLEPKCIYYEKLLPYDIRRYLNAVSSKKGVKIGLRPFPDSPEEAYRIVRDFSDDQSTQKKASVLIREAWDADGAPSTRVTSIVLRKHFLANETPTSLSAYRDAPYVYAESEGGLYVIDRLDNLEKVMVGREATISTGDFSLKTMCMLGEDEGGKCLEFEGVHLPLTESAIGDSIQFTFETKHGVRRAYNTLSFVSQFVREGELFLDGNLILRVCFSDETENKLADVDRRRNEYLRAVKALDAMGVADDLDMNTWDDANAIRFALLVDGMLDDKPLAGIRSDNPIGYYTIGNGRIYVIQSKSGENAGKVSSIYSERSAFAFGTYDEQEGAANKAVNPVPTLMALTKDDFKNALNLDADKLDSAFETLPITEGNQAALNDRLLQMLRAYDEGAVSPVPLLKCCEVVARRLYEVDRSSVVGQLNLLQTVRRGGTLSADDKKALRGITVSSDETAVKAAAYALLEEGENARAWLAKCDDEQLSSLYGWPIERFLPRVDCSDGD